MQFRVFAFAEIKPCEKRFVKFRRSARLVNKEFKCTVSSQQSWFFFFARLLISLLLSISAFLKVRDGTSTIHFVVPLLEFALSYALLVMGQNPVVLLIGGITFSGFAVVNIGYFVRSVDSCGCFGNTIQVHPIWMLLVDSLAAAILFSYSRKLWGSMRTQESPNWIHSSFSPLLIGAIAVGCISQMRMPCKIAVGEISRTEVEAGIVRVVCRLKNVGADPAVIDSVRTSCSCASAGRDQFPVQVSPGSTVSIEFLVRKNEDGELPSNQVAELFVKGAFLSRLSIPLTP